jgi:G6PDH family F420-dependent oxidoreductase
MRMHPALVAQAAATSACLMPGRFFLGVGSGENLNEHITGAAWPAADLRLSMLREAIGAIRALWSGEEVTQRGTHFTVDHARLYSLPDPLPTILVAAGGETSAQLAGECGDGLISTAPQRDLVTAFERAGGDGPRYAQMTVCWADTRAAAQRIARERWPNAALAGDLKTELALPRFFAAAAESVSEEQIAQRVICGPDPRPYLAKIDAFAQAGFDHVCLHQIGDDQAGFLRFATRELMASRGADAASHAAQAAGR